MKPLSSSRLFGHEWFVPVVAAILATAIRWYYVHVAIVVNPIRGDAVQYVIYAINLIERGIFSLQPDTVAPVPDAFRDPGYPSFLATCMALFGRDTRFYMAVLDIQAVMAGLTVGLATWLCREYVGRVAAILAGVGLSFWPHLVSSSGYFLSETLLGTLVALACTLLSLAIDRYRLASRKSAALAAASGLSFAAAGLTNAVVLPFMPAVAAWAAWKDPARRRTWLIVAITAMLPCACWLARNATLDKATDGGGNRIAMNFVQGSWPAYHAAWHAVYVERDSRGTAVLEMIDQDYQRLVASPGPGLMAIADRLAQTPLSSLLWYASKPAELWGWSIGIGADDIHAFPTLESPLKGHGLLRATTDICFGISPLLAWAALAGIVLVGLRRRSAPAMMLVASGLTVYVTCVFAVLQADARYATPYPPFEWLLAAYAVQAGLRHMKERHKQGKQ